MRLSYIEIQGFKSFPDKVKITFDQPYTAIVGPNGSGKSNISDAVRWVLGEQSTKSLRGGKMEDVIFGGTQLRKPMGFAQVSLCLEDAEKRLSGNGEIVVARRYYRSGDSEYLINGSPVRLRDLREAFMDTGLGRDGYSIIGQGRIAEIVSAKSEERREIFEEASGIAKYRFRKNEAGRKLAAAEDNLSRLRDILDELEGRIAPLTEQSEKAKRFLTFAEEKKSLEITLYCDTIERTRENMRAQDDKIAIAGGDYAAADEKLLGINESIEQMADKSRKLNADIDLYNADIIAAGEEAARIESEVAVWLNDVAHANEQMALLETERDGLSSDGGGMAAELENQRNAIAQKQSELDTLERLITEAEQELAGLIESSERSDIKRNETARRLTELQMEVTDLRVANVAAASSAETLDSRAGSVDEVLPGLKKRLDAAETELNENEGYLASLMKDMEEGENQIRGYGLKLDSRRQRLNTLEAELEKKDYEIRDLAHKAAVLEAMDKNLEGLAPGVRLVVKASDGRELNGIIGTVASLIKIKSGNETAIETALGMAAQNIVVEDERAAKQAIRYLKDAKAGRATFLPLDTIKPSRFDERDRLKDNGIVGLASELVESDSRYRDIVSNLLGRVVVAEDLDAASAAAKRMNYRCRVVTLDGQVINAGGSYTGGYTARQGGMFTRRGEIDRLNKRVEELKASTESARREREAAVKEVAALEEELRKLRESQITASQDRIRTEGVIARLRADIEQVADGINDAQAELASIAATRSEKQLLISANEGKISVLEAEILRLTQADDSDLASGDEFVARRSQLANLIGEHKIARVERQKDIENIEQAIERLSGQSEHAGRRAADIARTIAQLEAQNAARRTRIEASRAEAERRRQAAAQRRQDIEKAIAERTEAERLTVQSQSEYGELARRREEIGREISRLEERKTSLQADYDTAAARLWEEYELTRAEAEAFRVPFNGITELRQKVGSLRAKIKALGAVNLGAIEELKEVTERFEFLSAQSEDVEKSKNELIKLIAKLEAEMTEIFTKNFTEIGNRFRVVFTELFGGGSARLWLSDEGNVLESGIEIDVQPPGKVIKNLAALSGGEQALAAIALYFSILAVNPSPFCILDEIDSALDEANVGRFATYLRRVLGKTQIVAITHRRGTMEAADILYGVTMQEEGVSKMLKLGIDEAELVLSK